MKRPATPASAPAPVRPKLATPPLLDVRDLKVHFPIEKGILARRRVGWLKAVDGVSFSIAEGEALGLVGESGCGKSTTALAIAQLQRISSGSIFLEGEDLASMSPQALHQARRKFQMVFQDPYSSLDPRMKAGDIIAEPLRIHARSSRSEARSVGPESGPALDEASIQARTRFLMDKVGLLPSFADRYPHEFSGGQRQRIGIARALALEPKLVIADEPVSALDVSIQSQILNLLKDLQEELDLTFLFIAHNLAVVEYFCSRIVVMYLGTAAECAPSALLYERPLHPYTKALLSAVPLPDPPKERARKRIILKGDVPSPARERKGCPFLERCSEAFAPCSESRPPFVEVEPGRSVACFLYAGRGAEARGGAGTLTGAGASGGAGIGRGA